MAYELESSEASIDLVQQIVLEYYEEIIEYYRTAPDAPRINELYTSNDIFRELVFRGFGFLSVTDLLVQRDWFIRSTGLAYSICYSKKVKNERQAELLNARIGIPGYTTINHPSIFNKTPII